MKALVLYRPDSEHSRNVEMFVREFQKRYPGKELEVINIDSREGVAKAKLYDIMTHPAVLAIQENGAVNQIWQGSQLPLFDDLAANLH